MFKRPLVAALGTALLLGSRLSHAATHAADAPPPAPPGAELLQPQTSMTDGSVTVAGHRIDYRAVAGTLIVHGKGDHELDPTVSMFYVAYFKKGAQPSHRPVTFIYNGGPGSSSMWLHMGAFGPRRVVTANDSHTEAAPYSLVNNDSSLLDVTDVVFIDAPGTGFSRLVDAHTDPVKHEAALAELKKTVYSVDGDGQAFAQFITQFLSRYSRWNSPKYLFGESYGTTRSAVLANLLENQENVDLNGVILLSQILNFDNNIDDPEFNPGVDLPYVLALPTYAATAWYHHKLPQQPADLETFLRQVQAYAVGPYNTALMQGAALSAADRQAVAEQLHQYIGLPVDYLLKADLRVNGGMFTHELLASSEASTGRLDTRFQGPSTDPLAKQADYDPQSSAISSAYVSLFNDYVRQTLKFGQGETYRLFGDIPRWDMDHRQPGTHEAMQLTTNVMPDLAMAMKTNPNLKVMLNGGYYDLATPYFAAQFEMSHLPIQAELQKNISYHWYPSGHMVYANTEALKQLHDNVVQFIDQTDGQNRR
ncbi:S10 family peptidase [Frateuria aurantia]